VAEITSVIVVFMQLDETSFSTKRISSGAYRLYAKAAQANGLRKGCAPLKRKIWWSTVKIARFCPRLLTFSALTKLYTSDPAFTPPPGGATSL